MIGGPDAVDRIRELTGGPGADYAFEATGDVRVMRQAVESVRMGWGLCVLTGVAERGALLEVVPRLLITGRRVTGCELGGIRGRTGVADLVDTWLAGELDVAALVTARLSLSQIDLGFDMMRRREGVRSVVVFT